MPGYCRSAIVCFVLFWVFSETVLNTGMNKNHCGYLLLEHIVTAEPLLHGKKLHDSPKKRG